MLLQQVEEGSSAAHFQHAVAIHRDVDARTHGSPPETDQDAQQEQQADGCKESGDHGSKGEA